MGEDAPAPALRRPSALMVVGVVYALAAATLVFWPSRVTDLFGGTLESVDHAYRYGSQLLEIGANILLFVPAGWLAGRLLPRGWRWLAVVGGVAASVGIELIQATFLPDRVASPTDVLANSLGTILGLIIATVSGAFRSRRKPGDRPVAPQD